MPSPRKTTKTTAIPRISSTTEFARYVGLARTTVSRVLNGQPGLKQKTIDRVQRAMAETGFTPNAYALHLKGKRTALVGLCVENLLTPPAVSKLAELQSQLRQHGYSSLIEVLDRDSGQKVIRHFLSMRVEAIGFIGHFDEAELTRWSADLSRQDLPHVIIDQAGIPGAPTVTLDRAKAMTEVINHLVGLGHRNFGLLGVSGTQRGTQDRIRGVDAALAAHGLQIAACTRSLDHLHPRRTDFEYGRLLAQSFAQLADRPTAYLALNDEIAIGAMHGFQHRGFSVPGDLSITGFNNQDICEMTTPGLTSVDQQIGQTIRAATELLLAQIRSATGRKPLLRMIAPDLVVRGSTGAKPVG
ncbi:MAG: LacI family DNA-binding transcriptional regulator [Opitutae bacterium]|nr:LacI family DNA-binding transcriptional regulator [Opitutae bacterium]